MTTSGMSRWLVVPASALILFHLSAVVIGLIAAPSGPWFMPPDGGDYMPPPTFARALGDYFTPKYLRPLHLEMANRFGADRHGEAGVYFEARLTNASGNVMTVRVPDDRANSWVRHRQAVMARGLIPDIPVMPRPGEALAAPGQDVRTITIWDMSAPQQLNIRAIPEHLIPRDRPVSRPNDWSMVLARSYARYLCRTHAAESVELIRHTKYPIPPAVLFMGEPPQGAFDELVANFGDLPR
jgi:hypothetical protein